MVMKFLFFLSGQPLVVLLLFLLHQMLSLQVKWKTLTSFWRCWIYREFLYEM